MPQLCKPWPSFEGRGFVSHLIVEDWLTGRVKRGAKSMHSFLAFPDTFIISMVKWAEALSLLHRDIYYTGRPQCQVMDWIWPDDLAGNQGKADALGDGGKQ